MVNWYGNIYPFQKFNSELTQLWMLNKFDKKSAREWLEAGLQPDDYDFAEWLVKKNVEPNNFLENYDYEQTKNTYQTKSETVELRTIEGPGFKVYDTTNLPFFNKEKAKKRIEIYKALDKGKKLRTKIVEIDPMHWGPLRFTISDPYRVWDCDDLVVSFFTENIEPYKNWKVGDEIEIDIERLNSEKYTFEIIKERDTGIVKLIWEPIKAKTENKKLSDKAKLRAKNNELKRRIEELEKELALEKQLREKLLEEYNSLQKMYSEELEKKIIFTI